MDHQVDLFALEKETSVLHKLCELHVPVFQGQCTGCLRWQSC